MKKEVIDSLKQKYAKYDIYLEDKFYDDLVKEEIVIDPNSDINVDVQTKIFLNNQILKELCKQAKDDFDLEVKLVDYFKPIVNIILRKYNFKNIDNIRDDILMDTLESYDGKINFYIYLTKIIKKYAPTRKIESIDNKIAKYLKNNLVDKQNADDFEIKFKENIKVEQLKNIDQNLKYFIYLKYGYYKNIYFSLKDISNILKLDYFEVNSLYVESIALIKENINDNNLLEKKLSKKHV